MIRKIRIVLAFVLRWRLHSDGSLRATAQDSNAKTLGKLAPSTGKFHSTSGRATIYLGKRMGTWSSG